MFNKMICATHRSVRFGEQYFHSLIRLHSSVQTSTETNSIPPDVLPPLKRHRTQTSILNALASCIKPVPEAPDFRLGADPWLGSTIRLQSYLLAKAKGRLAARMAARDYFPNDIVGVAKEFPRIDHLLPLQTPDSILDRVTNGSLTKVEAMERLILLLAPRQAWKLYSLSEEEKWSEQTLHRLLDLLCATNCGDNNISFSYLNGCDWSNLPDPDEIYFTEELESRFRAKIKLNSKSSTKPNSGEPPASLNSDEKNHEPDARLTSPEDLSITSFTEAEDSESVLVTKTWSCHNSAEQLFLKESDVLRTPTAYRSMIRGASKFGDPNRALEMAELAWSSPAGNSSLDLPTYNILLRSLHRLKSVENGTTDLWALIVRIVDKMRAAKLPVHISTFNNILYTLSEAAVMHKKQVISSLSTSSTKQDYVPQGLGLMQEIRRLGLKPTLGTMNNLLRLVASTVVDCRKDSNTMFVPVYSSTEMLKSFITELEQRFSLEPISRFDYWTADDYSFFPTAMNIAWMERDYNLGFRINNLLMGDQDRRFLLPTSMAYRKYAYTCSMLMFSRMKTDLENPINAVKRFDNTYKFFRDSILTTEKLISRLIHAHSHLLHTNAPAEHVASYDQARMLSFTSLCHLMDDLLERNHSMGLNLSKNSTNLIQLLVEFAHLNPTLASQLSAKILSVLKQIDDRMANDATRSARSPMSTNTLGPVRRRSPQPDLISSFVHLIFPALIPLPTHGVSERSKGKVLDTLQEWFDYATMHNVISWSWAPRGLAIMLQQDISLSNDFIWTVLEHLNRPGNDFADSDSKIITKDLMDPVLNFLQSNLNQTDMHNLKKVELLNSIRKTLSSSSNIPDPYDTSSSSSDSESSSDSDNGN